MKNNRMKDALENIARRGVPENINLWPNIAARLERKSLMMTLRTRPVLLILTILFALTLLTGVVYAVGRLTGYIPGIGFVETSSLRVLVEPVSQTREGITVTIEQVVANSERTIIVYNHNATNPELPTYKYPDTVKGDRPALILSDGSRLDVRVGRRMASDGARTQYSLEFPPLPVDVMDVTLELTRLAGMLPGIAPEDWQIPLQLKPAPEGTVLPLIELPETGSGNGSGIEAGTPSLPTPPEADPNYGIQMSLESFVPLDDGYLLIGKMQWFEKDYPAYAVNPVTDSIKLTDANGKDVYSELVYGLEVPQNEEYVSYIAIKTIGTDFTAPLTFSMDRVAVSMYPVSFSFDPGANPKAEQTWMINQGFQLAVSTVRILSVRLLGLDSGDIAFQFDVQVDPQAVGDLYLGMPINQCMGGGGGYPNEHSNVIQVYVPTCRTALPAGPLEVRIDGAMLWGQWQAAWQP